MPQLPAIYSVKYATTGPIDLTGGVPSSVDGVASFQNDEVLVHAQTDSVQNGIYRVQDGGWLRHEDWDADEDFEPGRYIYVVSGTYHGGSSWKFANEQIPTVGSYNLNFIKGERREAPFAQEEGGIVVAASGGIALADLTDEDPGVFSPLAAKIDKKGRVQNPASVGFRAGYMEGLGFESVGATNNIIVQPGACYIPATGRIAEILDPLTVPIPNVDWPVPAPGGGGQSYPLFIGESNGQGFVHVGMDATEVAGPEYFSSARTMYYDDSLRYIGQVLTDVFGNLFPFIATPLGGTALKYTYLHPYWQSHPNTAMLVPLTTAGVQTLSVGPGFATENQEYVGAGARNAIVQVDLIGSANFLLIGWVASGNPPIWTIKGQMNFREIPLNANGQFKVKWDASSTSNSGVVEIRGYYEAR